MGVDCRIICSCKSWPNPCEFESGFSIEGISLCCKKSWSKDNHHTWLTPQIELYQDPLGYDPWAVNYKEPSQSGKLKGISWT